MHLPRSADESEAGAAQATEMPKPPAIGLHRDVLVVDDNVDAAKSLSMLLRVLGQRTRIAHDAEGALALIEERRPDVVFLDIGLPHVDGYELARRIRQLSEGQNIILVALTGWGQEDDRRRSREAGFDDHLTKPIDHATLERVLALPGRQQIEGR